MIFRVCVENVCKYTDSFLQYNREADFRWVMHKRLCKNNVYLIIYVIYLLTALLANNSACVTEGATLSADSCSRVKYKRFKSDTCPTGLSW